MLNRGCAAHCLLCNVCSVGWSAFFQRGVGYSQGACVGARAGVGTWVRACRGAGVTIFSRANREPGARILCWYGRASVRVCRRMGVLVSVVFFSVHTCLSLTVSTTRGTVPLT